MIETTIHFHLTAELIARWLLTTTGFDSGEAAHSVRIVGSTCSSWAAARETDASASSTAQQYDGYLALRVSKRYLRIPSLSE